MDLWNFLKILKKRLWLVVLFPLIAVPTVILLTMNQSKSYKSFIMISTGLSNRVSLDENTKLYIQMRRSGNMLELARSRTVYELLGFHLLYHDLTSESPFRQVEKNPEENVVEMEKRGLAILERKLFQNDDYLIAPEEYRLLRELLALRNYDYQKLLKQFSIYPLGESDFIRIVFEAEKPELVVYALEKIADVYINKYQDLVTGESSRSREFFENQVAVAKEKLHLKEKKLEEFKEQNNIINLEEQIKNVVTQLTNFENIRDVNEQKIESLKATIWQIESQLSNGTHALEATDLVLTNTNLINLKDEIKNLENAYLRNKYIRDDQNQEDLELKINQKREQLKQLTKNLWKSQIINPQESRQELASLLINSKVELEVAQAKQKVLEEEIQLLKQNSKSFVSLEANYSKLKREINVAEKEYLDMVNKLNLAKAYENNSLTSLDLKVVEHAFFPLKPTPSKRKLYILIAFIASVAIGIVSVFVIEYIDVSVRTPNQAEKVCDSQVKTGFPEISLNSATLTDCLLNPKSEDQILLKEAFRRLRNQIHNKNVEQDLFKNTLQRNRNNSDTNNNGAINIAITSSKKGEGKSFLSVGLGVILSLSKFRVLLIDANFRDPTLERYFDISADKYFQDILADDIPPQDAVIPTKIENLHVLCAKKSTFSPAEYTEYTKLNQILRELKNHYDYVVYDTAAMNFFSDTIELNREMNMMLFVMQVGKHFDEVDRRSLNIIKSDRSKFLGIVLNRMNNGSLSELIGDKSRADGFLRRLIS